MLDPQSLADMQRQRNQASQAAWNAYASHRQQIQAILERLLLQQVADQRSLPTIAVLGAGNCNDLDLQWLAERFAQIHLIDLDREAVEAAVTRQAMAAYPAISIDAPCDFGGLVESNSPPDSTEPRFDVVLSSCVLSQIIEAASLQTETLDINRIQALRRHHLLQIIQRLQPGGRGILVTDFCSSDTWPELHRLTDEQLAAAAMQQLRLKNFFTGLNPLVICQLLKDSEEFQQLVLNVRVTQPWKWQHSQHRVYAVCAIGFSRHFIA